MNRQITRRLERLETQVKAVARPPLDHVLCFVDTDHRIASQYEMATGKWTHFDPPQDRKESK